MSESTPDRKDIWEQWDGLWQILFYIAILAPLGISLTDPDLMVVRSNIIALGGVLLVWHIGGMWLTHRGQYDYNAQAPARLLVLIGDIVIWFLLVSQAPVFNMFLFGMFPQIFRTLPLRFATLGVAILIAAIMYWQLVESGEGFSFSNPVVLVYVFMGIGIIGFGSWVSAIIRQSGQRRELIAQLEAAQSDLAAAERRQGVLEERSRLASEIHDTLAQGFTSIVMLLEGLEQALPADVETTVTQNLKLSRDTARQSLEQARRLVWELRPEPLENGNLPESLQRVSDIWAQRTSVPANFVVTGQVVGLHPEMEIALLRTLQEGLHNIQKHAQANQVNVTLSYMGDVVILDIADDGLGFDVAQTINRDQYGLTAMRQRAEKLGGKVSIDSEPGGGATLALELPCREQS